MDTSATPAKHTELYSCDIVMKGGVTSGIVYPSAIFELSKTYRFRSIGGTSAGAIAAAATAAAELGRACGNNSFDELRTIPKWLGASPDQPSWWHPGPPNSHLFYLFQPEPATASLFHLLVAFLGESQGRVWRVIGALLANYWYALLLGACPGLLLLLLILASGANPWATLWAALLLMIIGVPLVTGAVIAYQVLTRLPQNGYGLCKGHTPGAGQPGVGSNAAQPADAERPALVDWLSALLDRLARQPNPNKPLTFGDLWLGTNAPAQDVGLTAMDGPTNDGKSEAEANIEEAQPPKQPCPPGIANDDKCVNLAMITTNLSHGRPYRLPFDTRIFYFSPNEFRTQFPDYVVDWMVAKAPPPDNKPYPKTKTGEALLPFPCAHDLPVVVATRMSLSFPILVSAVPLYAIDYSKSQRSCDADDQPGSDEAAAAQSASVVPVAEKCWFSDGGISSNFPVHFFDSPLPRWPTFAINLRDFPPGCKRDQDEAKNIWAPSTNGSGIIDTWNYFDDKVGLGKLPAFLAAIWGTAQNWSENVQLLVPGYRDRIVHVYQGADEGGLNLKMPGETICSLAERGGEAGKNLVERFGNPESPAITSWENHRWIRYRTTMLMLTELFDKIAKRYAVILPPTKVNYNDLILPENRKHPNSYPFIVAEQGLAVEATKAVELFAEQWHKNQELFQGDAPDPAPEFQIRPKLYSEPPEGPSVGS